EGVGATAAALVDLSTVAGNKISNPPWVKFQSAGWVNFPSAPTPKSAKLQSLSFNARAIAADVAQDITDRFALLHSCDLHRSLQSGYMHAFVHLVHDMPSGALLNGITCASNTALRDSEPAAKLRGFLHSPSHKRPSTVIWV
ncbi:hypothetical protein, partial [Pseudomonas aeruginosa]|uniref:hypothetical protein n=1 Tax=Pseudomonas aeruginosa TaxID=287 RepID=UPI003FD102C0